MFEKLKSKLRYVAVGDPNKRELVPTIDAQSGDMTGSEFIDKNSSFLNRIKETLGVPASKGPMPSQPYQHTPVVREEAYLPAIARGTPTPTPRPANSIEQILSSYEIPLPVFYGMRDAEGGVIGSNNPMNIGAFDSNPTAAVNYPTPEEGIEAFARLISGDKRYEKAYKLRNNPEAMLQAIMDAGYAGDPKTWKQRSIDTKGAGSTYDTYSEFVKDTPGWRKNYKKK